MIDPLKEIKKREELDAMIIERKVGDKVYMVRVEGIMEEADAIRLGNQALDDKIAAEEMKPRIDAWKTEWEHKKQKVQKLKEAALQHYRVTVPLPAQAIIKKMASEDMVISSSQLEVLNGIINPGVISIVHEMRAKLDYNILKVYWNAELDWANMRHTYPQVKA